MAEHKGLVLVDSSALEGHYLRPILRGEGCRDIAAIAKRGYQPAVLQKTLAEIWLHAKLGTGNASTWAKESGKYPGPIDQMVTFIGRLDSSANARETAWLWFNLSEKWPGRTTMRDAGRAEFLQWKQKMEHFCLSVEDSLTSSGILIVSSWHMGATAYDRYAAGALEREIALNSLLPNEDSAWIVEAILLKARAIVTCDNGIVGRGRISLGFSVPGLSAVHPTRLTDALRDDFGLASYPKTG